MKRLALFALAVFALSFAESARANPVFYDQGCAVEEFEGGAPLRAPVFFAFSSPSRLTCEKLKSSKEAWEIVNLALLPASIALKTPAVGARLAALGLTMANPAVMAVTVVGAVGYVTVYLVLQQTYEQCARMEQESFKRQVFEELEQRYNLKVAPSLPISYQN